MKKYSIFQRVLVNNFKVMLIPLILIMLFVNIYVCIRQKNNIRDLAQKELDTYASAVAKRIDSAIGICENVGRYGYLTDTVTKKFTSNAEAFEFTHSINEYLDSFIKVEDGVDITIYVANDSIFVSKYFERMENLKEHHDVLNKINEQNISIVWNDHIQQDETYGDYFLFYKAIHYQKDVIIGCRVYIGEVPENVSISGKNEKLEGEYVSAEINHHFGAQIKIDYYQIYLLWVKTTVSIITIILLLTFILYKSAQKSTDYTTAEIREFINSLEPDTIADSGVAFTVDTYEAGEMQIIKKTILNLIEKVEDVSQKKHHVELERERIKFALLQSQVNPHFMYNSLSALRLGASMNKDESMVSLIDNMVSYYRLVLSQGKTIVTLEEELDLIRKYVKIIELSHLDDYNLKITASEESLKADVLHMLLQPFVENALGHGLSGVKKKEMRLSILCEAEGDYLVVRITDNGRGMDENKLSLLNNLQKYDGSYGIKNAYMRLKMTYGDNSSVRFESRENEGTSVVIKFPKKVNNDF